MDDTRKYTFDVVIGNWVQTVTLDKQQDGFVEHIIDLPHEVTQGKEKIRVMFRAGDTNRVSSIYECRLITK